MNNIMEKSKDENSIKTNYSQHLGQTIKYIIVGGLSFGVDFIVLKTFSIIIGDKNYQIAVYLGLISGLFINYLLSKLWVFKNNTRVNKKEVFSFALFTSFGFAFTGVGMYFLHELLILGVGLSKFIVASIVFIMNFFARKYFIFNKQQNK